MDSTTSLIVLVLDLSTLSLQPHLQSLLTSASMDHSALLLPVRSPATFHHRAWVPISASDSARRLRTSHQVLFWCIPIVTKNPSTHSQFHNVLGSCGKSTQCPDSTTGLRATLAEISLRRTCLSEMVSWTVQDCFLSRDC